MSAIDTGIAPVRARRAGADPLQSRRKRALDLLIAAAALVLLAPLFLAVALAISTESRGPILFRQARTGLRGRQFIIFKFRTMRAAGADEPLRQAKRGDPRVTQIGRVLRKLSIDELPQLMNVLRGDMSIVGPRPHALTHDETWSIEVPRYAERFRTRPGLTGRAQVAGLRGEILTLDDIAARVAADNLYIDRWSFAGDLHLIANTAVLIFRDQRAY